MEKTANLDTTPTSDKEYEAMSEHYLGKIKLLQQQMDQDQQDIEAMRAETDAMLASIMRTLKAA